MADGYLGSKATSKAGNLCTGNGTSRSSIRVCCCCRRCYASTRRELGRYWRIEVKFGNGDKYRYRWIRVWIGRICVWAEFGFTSARGESSNRKDASVSDRRGQALSRRAKDAFI